MQANLHSTQNGTVDGELKRQKEEFPEEAVGDADMVPILHSCKPNLHSKAWKQPMVQFD